MAFFKRFRPLLVKPQLQETQLRPYSFKPPNKKSKGNPVHLDTLLRYIGLVTAGISAAALFSTFLKYRVRSHTEAHQLVKTSHTVNKKSEPEPDQKQIESLRNKYNFIDKIVKKCVPAVFYLEIRDPNRRDPETGKPLVMSNGSGFIINENGYALTNAHVILNKPDAMITAVMHDGTTYKVKVEDADLNIDIALLKLQGSTNDEKFPMLHFGKAGDAIVGEWVVALGSPLSLSNSVTVGIVSNINRPADELGLKNYSMKYIQTDASITFGNSGGPLVNLDGDVIGINNLRLTSGISFAIPVDYVQKFLENNRLMRENKGKADMLGNTLFGLTTISITSELLNDLLRKNKIVPDEVNQGLLVWKVLHGTPAQRSGLEAGDIITHVNGIPVKEASDMYALSHQEKSVKVGIIHQGKKREITLDNYN